MKWWVIPVAAVGVAIVGVSAYGAKLVLNDELPWRKLSAVSESMAPTIRKGDTLTARRKPATELKRGDIVAFAVGDGIWLQRVAGLPGDRIEMRAGQLVVNGKPVSQTAGGAIEVDGQSARILSEQFPGEAAPHRVLDLGSSPGDDMAAIQVLPGRLFLLGDNRDNSADSRYPVQPGGMGGSGLVPFADVYGTVVAEDVSGG